MQCDKKTLEGQNTYPNVKHVMNKFCTSIYPIFLYHEIEYLNIILISLIRCVNFGSKN